jgi:aspartyl-tRNA(Asn)/glutamyl-tRNA(Gln) amidotransferase subunit A
VIIGKTNLPEFAAKGVVDPPLFGHTRNPWALDRTVGGSSGGAAAAVATGMGPLAIGNDQAGSVRMPASFCGVTALKPTGGRIPFFPSDNLWDFIFHVGPIARTVGDLDLALRVLEGPDTRDPMSLPPIAEEWDRTLDDLARPWRVAWSGDLGYAEADHEVGEICRRAFERLAEAGQADDVDVDLGAAVEAYVTTVSVRRGAALAEVIDEWEPLMDPFVVEYTRQGLRKSVADIGRGHRARNHVHLEVERVFADVDLLVTPTLAVPAFEVAKGAPDHINGRPLEAWFSWFPFTYPFNLTGHPAATVPVGFTAGGLPVGLQIVGRKFADRDVLAACRYLERALPWAGHRPGTTLSGS